MDHEPRDMSYDRSPSGKIPTLTELINMAPPEYLENQPFKDAEGKLRTLSTVTSSLVFSLVK